MEAAFGIVIFEESLHKVGILQFLNGLLIFIALRTAVTLSRGEQFDVILLAAVELIAGLAGIGALVDISLRLPFFSCGRRAAEEIGQEIGTDILTHRTLGAKFRVLLNKEHQSGDIVLNCLLREVGTDKTGCFHTTFISAVKEMIDLAAFFIRGLSSEAPYPYRAGWAEFG